MALKEQNINAISKELLNNVSNWKLDQLVVWLSSATEFDVLLDCIHKELKSDIKQLKLVSEIIETKKDEVVPLNYFVEHDSMDDLMLYIISRLRDKRFTLLNMTRKRVDQQFSNDYELIFLNFDGTSFNVPFSTFINILRNVHHLPDYEGPALFGQEKITELGGNLPFYYGKLFGDKVIINNDEKVIFDGGRESIKEQLGDETKTIEFSVPRMIKLDVRDNGYALSEELQLDSSGRPIPNRHHIPSSYGPIGTEYSKEKGKYINGLLKCQLESITIMNKFYSAMGTRSPKLCFGKNKRMNVY